MIIKLHGETSLNKLPKILKEVITDIQNRAGLDEAKFNLKDLEVGILFNVGGEKMLLSVEHEGVKETFKVHVQLDEKGNIKAKKDNEEESFLDDFEKGIAKGSPTGITEIASVYDNEDLVYVDMVEADDLKEITYKVHGTEEYVKRYYRNNILVGEIGYKQKEGK